MAVDSEYVENARHEHVFLGRDHERNERRVWMVIALTTVMMVAEIASGTIYGSMALTADGWHMSTHAGAMLISALAYMFARKYARDPRYTFGTGKFGDLAGFASAVILALVALLIAWESVVRLVSPVEIDFNQAILVAVLGLAVNLVSAWLLKDDHAHHGHAHHGHDHHNHSHSDEKHHHDHGSHGAHAHSSHAHHSHAHGSHGSHGGSDNNLRAAYLHVLADALTSVLAIVALLLGKWQGWVVLDPLMGVVGGIVIARWSWGLVRATSGVLLDALPADKGLSGKIRAIVEKDGDVVTDLHVWQVGPGHYATIVALVSPAGKSPEVYKKELSKVPQLAHVTVEVSAAA